jgi:Tol biopolymer transport system component/predicted Ser/Thr protein kinase
MTPSRPGRISPPESPLPLAAGTQLGHYEIVAPLGSGGMGEVYRARDVRLQRSVALKVLRDGTASDPERRARLRQEARAIASLSHPGICALYDVGVSGDSDFLVMELIQGEVLQERLRRGPMPVREVLQRGAEIADALQFAHRAGILHRDLKPGNVMLTKTGAKLLDFGLARVKRQSPLGSTTESLPITGEGIAVGTIHYMSPEQLTGGDVDARSDIWSLGATLFEMLSAQRPFDAPSTVGLMTAILKEEPRLSALSAQVPASLRRVLQRCLAKDPDSRWQSAGDLANELRWMAEDSSGAQLAAQPGLVGPSRFLQLRWAGWWVGAVAVVVALTLARSSVTPSSRDVVRSHIIPPDGAVPARENIAVSPDGKTLAFVIPDSVGVSHLFIRRMDALEAVQLGTTTANLPFWSPDSRQVGFVTDEERLVKQSLDGGAPQTICTAPHFVSATWGAGHWIVFTTGIGPLLKVKDTGGTPEIATVLDTTRHEVVHGYPWFLPDGRHFTYVAAHSTAPSTNSIQAKVGCTDGSAGWDLMLVQHAPVCDGRGWLVFMRDRALLAQRVDRTGRRLLGDPIPMVEIPARAGSSADPIALVAGGTLVYHEMNDKPCDICWYSRAGVLEQRIAATPFVIAPAVSPDGKRAIMRGVQGGETWLVSVDLTTGEVRRLTSEMEWNSWPTWDASGKKVFYASTQGGQQAIKVMDPDHPNTSQLVCTAPEFLEPDRPTPDGRTLITGTETTKGTGDDLVLRDLVHPEKPEPLLATPANESCAAIIGDGKWFVYSSDESGRTELYADQFPGLGHRVRLTRDGCAWMDRHYFWIARDEIFYASLDRKTLHALRFEVSAAGVRPVSDQALFALPMGFRGECPSPDGRRILMVTSRAAPALTALTLVQNWQQGLVHNR